MFTINIYLRFALIIGGLGLGIGLWAAYGFWYGFPFLLVGIVMLLGYLFLGTIMSANQFLSKQQFEEAEKRLNMTYFPRLLLVGYRGVFYMTQGAVEMQRKDFNKAEALMKQSLASGLPSDNERGAALLQLVLISAAKNNRQGAVKHLAEIKKLTITEQMLKEQVKDIEKQLKQMNQGMNPANMAAMGKGGFRGGGKRPRPKMR
ncbi:MAG: hypothetical protein R2792_11130 [Saprospiraceae bacterium]|jgi:hypothetical protein